MNNLGDVLLTMVAFFFWVMAIWIFISIFGDIFRRDDLDRPGQGRLDLPDLHPAVPRLR